MTVERSSLQENITYICWSVVDPNGEIVVIKTRGVPALQLHTHLK